MNKGTDRQTDKRQTDSRQTGRQAGRQTDRRQTDSRQADRQTDKWVLESSYAVPLSRQGVLMSSVQFTFIVTHRAQHMTTLGPGVLKSSVPTLEFETLI